MKNTDNEAFEYFVKMIRRSRSISTFYEILKFKSFEVTLREVSIFDNSCFNENDITGNYSLGTNIYLKNLAESVEKNKT